MKYLSFITIAVFTVMIFINYGCKKDKTVPPVNTTCGCNATDIKYRLANLSCTLAYYQYKGKWVFSVQQGNIYSSYFPCNLTQDSLRAITQNANQSQTFQVKVSGKVKETCPNEDFGVTTGGTIDYLIIDSLKRN